MSNLKYATVGDLYQKLGLEPADQFAEKRRQYNRKHWSFPEENRQTGRTTKMLVTAISEGLRGGVVAVRAHFVESKPLLVARLQEMLDKLKISYKKNGPCEFVLLNNHGIIAVGDGTRTMCFFETYLDDEY